jgi:hypothetical protein
MGRQIAVVATEQDEQEFLAFLRSTAETAIFESVAPNTDALWVDAFAEEKAGHWQYRIWNKAFPWVPAYGQVREGSTRGWYYVSNWTDAPVIELDRCGLSRRFGRIYWAKDFAAPSGLAYNVGQFDNWFSTIVKWVRKEGVQRP